MGSAGPVLHGLVAQTPQFLNKQFLNFVRRPQLASLALGQFENRFESALEVGTLVEALYKASVLLVYRCFLLHPKLDAVDSLIVPVTTVQLKVVETQLVAYCDSFIPCMSSYK